jgi:DNA-binding CsgD family transcriptional regulator
MRRIPDPGLRLGADPQPGACIQADGMGDTELTDRERAAAILLAYGHTNDDVARALRVSLRTAEGERSRLMHKLGFERRSQLVRWALERGLLH